MKDQRNRPRLGAMEVLLYAGLAMAVICSWLPQ